MVLLLAVAAALAAVGLILIALSLRRSASSRAALVVMARRLRDGYGAAPDVADAVPLRAPPGLVAVGADGLCLHLGSGPAEFRFVPWSGVHSVTPAPGGPFAVRVNRVGVVEVPGSLGRALWDAFAARREPPAADAVERARLDRV